MKKLLLCLSILAGVLTSCGGDSDSEAVVVNPVGPGNCSSSITGFTVAQNAGEITFDIDATSGAIYYETSISGSNQNFGPDSGAITALDFQSNTVTLYNSGITNGDYIVWVRTVCPDNTKGAWFGPKLLTIEDYCEAPNNLHVTPNAFTWDYYNDVSVASNYQVQYGPQGFTLGTGTIATVNVRGYDDAVMQAGQSYDFYVRAFCTNSLGYSSWTGPFTYYAEVSSNICQAPSNVMAHVSNTSDPNIKNVFFSWNGNGVDTFEYVLMYDNEAPDEEFLETTSFFNESGNYTLETGTNYDFYLRSKCDNGDNGLWIKLDLNL